MIEWAGGVQPASPTPTPIRAASSWRKFRESPDATVIALQTSSARAMMLLRLERSARRAIGRPAKV